MEEIKAQIVVKKLSRIEEHLHALVYFQALQMTKQMADENTISNLDEADAKMKNLLKKAYKKPE